MAEQQRAHQLRGTSTEGDRPGIAQARVPKGLTVIRPDPAVVQAPPKQPPTQKAAPRGRTAKRR